MTKQKLKGETKNLGEVEEAVINATQKRILDMPISELLSRKLTREEWEILFSPDNLRATIKKALEESLGLKPKNPA